MSREAMMAVPSYCPHCREPACALLSGDFLKRPGPSSEELLRCAGCGSEVLYAHCKKARAAFLIDSRGRPKAWACPPCAQEHEISPWVYEQAGPLFPASALPAGMQGNMVLGVEQELREAVSERGASVPPLAEAYLAQALADVGSIGELMDYFRTLDDEHDGFRGQAVEALVERYGWTSDTLAMAMARATFHAGRGGAAQLAGWLASGSLRAHVESPGEAAALAQMLDAEARGSLVFRQGLRAFDPCAGVEAFERLAAKTYEDAYGVVIRVAIAIFGDGAAAVEILLEARAKGLMRVLDAGRRAASAWQILQELEREEEFAALATRAPELIQPARGFAERLYASLTHALCRLQRHDAAIASALVGLAEPRVVPKLIGHLAQSARQVGRPLLAVEAWRQAAPRLDRRNHEELAELLEQLIGSYEAAAVSPDEAWADLGDTVEAIGGANAVALARLRQMPEFKTLFARFVR